MILFRKKLLRFVSIFSFTAILILLFISQSTFVYSQEVWIFTQYCVPLLFLGVWVPYSLSFFVDSKNELKSLNRTFLIAIFGSVIVVLGALMLNTHLLSLIISSMFGLFNLEGDNLLINFLTNEIPIGILLPLNEEIVKIIPIIVLNQASVLILDTEGDTLEKAIVDRYQSVVSRRQYALYGITSGVVFTFLELFLYQWQSIEANIDPFSIVFQQVLLRTVAPVHVIASMFLALGIYNYKNCLAEDKSKMIAFLSSIKFLLIGWFIHAFWNSLNVYFAVYLPSMTQELFGVLLIFGLCINILLTYYIWKVFHRSPELCKSCGLEGKFHKHRKITPATKPTVSVFKKLLSFPLRISRRHLSYSYICQYCFSKITKGACSSCGARIYLACPSCNTYISETTNVCPNPSCSKKIVSLIENQFVALSKIETWIVGVSALASLAFILSPMSILFWMRQESYPPLAIFIFYFIVGLTILINIIITLFINRTAGILVLNCLMLNIVLLIVISAIGTALNGFLKSLLYLDLIGAIILLFALIFIIYLVKKTITIILENYKPVFPEFREHDQVVTYNE